MGGCSDGHITCSPKHRAEQQNDSELIYYLTDADGSTLRLVHRFSMKYFFRFELEHLLARSGFRVSSLYGNFDRSPFTDDSPEIIFEAQPGGLGVSSGEPDLVIESALQ